MPILIPITFFTPFIISSYLFLRSYIQYAHYYRDKKNPNFPIAPGEAGKFFSKDPIKYIITMPLYPFLMWKIIFESHKDQVLNKAATKTRNLFLLFLLVIILDFAFHFLAMKYGFFTY